MRSYTGLGVDLAILIASPKIARGQDRGESAASTRVIAGVVRDTTGTPIVGVQVRANGRQLALSDSVGRFRVNGVNEPSLSLTFRRLGYEPATRTLTSGNASSPPIEVVMTPNSQLLRTIVVEGQAYDKDLWANGFYHRQKVASGSFFDPDVLMHFGGSGLGSLMHEVPRVDVERKGNRDYAFSSVAGNRCRMNVYVDGVFQQAAMPSPRFGADDAVGLGDLVDFRDIRAVEVYPRATSVPTQFSRMGPGAGPQGRPMPRIPSPRGSLSATTNENQDAACGALVIWTKAPGEK